jgi:hypothetical protein
VVAAEVAAVGQGGDVLAARCLLCLERHGRELAAVVPLVSHLVGHDQMVLGIDGDLHIVADGSARVREASRAPGKAWPPQSGVRPIRQENKLLIAADFSPMR